MISKKITLRTIPLFEFEFKKEGFQVTNEFKDNKPFFQI